MALGAGSLPEELFGVCHRRDCPVVKMLRKRALRDLLTLGEPTPSALAAVADKAIKKIGYAAAEDVRGAVVGEYARLLSLDIPLGEDVAGLLGGRPGQTLEDLLYRSNDPVVNALHMAAMALYMEYADGADLQRLGVLDFAAYALLELLRRGRATRDHVAKLLSWIADQALSAT